MVQKWINHISISVSASAKIISWYCWHWMCAAAPELISAINYFLNVCFDLFHARLDQHTASQIAPWCPVSWKILKPRKFYFFGFKIFWEADIMEHSERRAAINCSTGPTRDHLLILRFSFWATNNYRILTLIFLLKFYLVFINFVILVVCILHGFIQILTSLSLSIGLLLLHGVNHFKK